VNLVSIENVNRKSLIFICNLLGLG